MASREPALIRTVQKFRRVFLGDRLGSVARDADGVSLVGSTGPGGWTHVVRAVGVHDHGPTVLGVGRG